MSQNSLTPDEVAKYLSIKTNTVYELVKRGELSAYRIGRKIRIDEEEVAKYKAMKHETPVYSESAGNSSFVICGQDVILDILARNMDTLNPGAKILRSYRGSYNGLYDLYNDIADVATAHLWDGDTDTYNERYVKSMLPGVPAKIFHLVKRNVGFYVKAGNPKGIRDWEDFRRGDIAFVNREKGSGIRVLTDEHLRLLGIKPEAVNGYNLVANSHISAAASVTRGYADFAVGNEKTAKQADGIEFVFLQQECYDLIVKESDLEKPIMKEMFKIIESDDYKNEILSLGGYELIRENDEPPLSAKSVENYKKMLTNRDRV